MSRSDNPESTTKEMILTKRLGLEVVVILAIGGVAPIEKLVEFLKTAKVITGAWAFFSEAALNLTANLISHTLAFERIGTFMLPKPNKTQTKKKDDCIRRLERAYNDTLSEEQIGEEFESMKSVIIPACQKEAIGLHKSKILAAPCYQCSESYRHTGTISFRSGSFPARPYFEPISF